MWIKNKGELHWELIIFFNFCLKKRLKDELSGNSNQLFSIPTEDRARENGPESLLEENEVRHKKEDSC